MQILSLNLLVSSNLHKNLIKLNRIYISERNISQLAVRSSVYSLHFGLMFQFQFMVSCFSFRLCCCCCCCSQFPVSINLPQIVFIHSIISFFHSAILHFANYNIADWIVAVLWPELRLSRLSICPFVQLLSRCCWIVRATQLNRAAIIFTCSRRHFAAFSAWHDCQKFPYPYPYSCSCRPIYLYLPLSLYICICGCNCICICVHL